MVEMCPKCGELRVSRVRSVSDGQVLTVYYRCDGGHEWREKRLARR